MYSPRDLSLGSRLLIEARFSKVAKSESIGSACLLLDSVTFSVAGSRSRDILLVAFLKNLSVHHGDVIHMYVACKYFM